MVNWFWQFSDVWSLAVPDVNLKKINIFHLAVLRIKP